MIAYHFPPLQGSSGIQRTLKFSKYLPELGWSPIILSAHPRAYLKTNNDLLTEFQDKDSIYRAFALDTSKHLSCMKRYPRVLAVPDRWVSWWLGAVPLGLYLIRKYKPDVIWSTYPIATAHLIGLSLHRMTGVPWVADFRDPMVEEGYPSDPLVNRSYQWIEKKTIAHCTRAVFTTMGTCNDYKTRYQSIASSRFSIIENGYDEEVFLKAETTVVDKPSKSRPFVLIHSGIVYPSERNPESFFAALQTLLQKNLISGSTLKVILRATFNDEYIHGLIVKYGIESIVTIAPVIRYQDALSEMLSADGLLILQGSNCNNQIPAKLYEYLRARRPILALTDSKGDTAIKLSSMGINTIAQLDSKEDIENKLMKFMELCENNNAQIAPVDAILSNSRKSRTEELVSLLNEIACEVR